MANFSVQESKLEDILPENTLKTRVPQDEVEREIAPAPSRYRNEIAKYIVRRSDDCKRCGKCAEVCPYGVHVRKPGYKYFCEPKSASVHRAGLREDGPLLRRASARKSALQIVENPMMKALGDYRWTADMILATWKMAETGEVPPAEYGYEYEMRQFRRRLRPAPVQVPRQAAGRTATKDEIDTSIELNRRGDGRPADQD